MEKFEVDASATVSKINSYRKLTTLCMKAEVGGWGGGSCYSNLMTGGVGTDQYVAKCFIYTFIIFDSDDNVVCME